jgi:hypothetical protein
MSNPSAVPTYVARRAGQDFYHLFEAATGRCVRSVNVPRNATVLVNGASLQVTEPGGRIVLSDISTGRFIRSFCG